MTPAQLTSWHTAQLNRIADAFESMARMLRAERLRREWQVIEGGKMMSATPDTPSEGE